MLQFSRCLAFAIMVAGGVLVTDARSNVAVAQSKRCMLGEIKLFAGDFAPHEWAFANGEILKIQDQQALYALLGKVYGGDGTTTFALPDLRGRIPVGAGKGGGLPQHIVGSKFGVEKIPLGPQHVPEHRHTAKTVAKIMVTSNLSNVATPKNNLLARTRTDKIYNSDDPKVTMSPNTITAETTTTNTGGGQLSNMQPSLGLHYIICIAGSFPMRN